MKITLCYKNGADLIAIIQNTRIDDMTHHEDGIYIYWKDFDNFNLEEFRAGCIICDYTIGKTVTTEELSGIQKIVHVPIILGPKKSRDPFDCITIK